MADLMTFPDTWEEFEQDYGFTDVEQIYTNGSRLIQSFRVKQWLDHISSETKAETDTISRQAAIDAIKEFQHGAAKWRDEQEERSDIWHRADSAIASALEIGLRVKKLPSAQPEPITVNIDHELTQEEYEKLRKDMANAPIMLLPAAQPEQRWIPCSERLPKLDNSYANSKEYLTQWDDGSIDITRYSNVSIFWQNEITEPYWKGEQCSKVTAWMPLPEPYKAESEDKE